jgi:recombination DNA repair RAD52 pathway protein
MNVWNAVKTPPASALKKIEAGRLKGKSDISPQWRYQVMTETFGMIGDGWKFTIDKTWTELAAHNETMVFVQVSVYVKVNDKWSEAVPGIGGSTLIVSESKGMHNDDDAYKKAVTDALSTALKMFGVAADVYLGLFDGSKLRDVSAEKPAAKVESKTHATTPERTELVKEFSACFNQLSNENKAKSLTIKGSSTIEEIEKALKHNQTLLENQK